MKTRPENRSARSEGHLDADGKLTVNVPTTVSDHKIDYRYRIEAARHRSRPAARFPARAGSSPPMAASSSTSSPTAIFTSPSYHGSFKVEARDYDNHPVSTRVHLSSRRGIGDNRNRQASERPAPMSILARMARQLRNSRYRPRRSLPRLGTAHTPEGRTVEQSTYIWVPADTEQMF